MAKSVLLSGTSNESLSIAIASQLGMQLGKREITRFIDNECRVWVKEDVADKTVFVIQSLSQIADQHLVELCLLGQAIKSLGATKMIAVIPWMGYSKQDKEFRKGEAVSAQLVAKVIEAAGFDGVITVELHSETLVPYFRVPVSELSTHSLLAQSLETKLTPGTTIVASPDSGGQGRSERFAKAVGLPIVYLEKTRDVTTGTVTVTGLSAPVTDKHVVIFDDIINTGATAIKTSEFLKVKGAKRIWFLATHAVLVGEAVELLSKSSIDEIVVSDTIYIPKEKQFSTLHIVSAAPLLAAAIRSATGVQ